MDGEKSRRRREDSRQETRSRGGAGSCNLHAASRKGFQVSPSSLGESVINLWLQKRERESLQL